MIGNTYYSYMPFIKAGLPVKSLPTVKEGTFGTGGSGNLTVIKAPAHPNSTKVFVNWILSRDGQEVLSRALGQATRRLDIDTKWLKEIGTMAAKDTKAFGYRPIVSFVVSPAYGQRNWKPLYGAGYRAIRSPVMVPIQISLPTCSATVEL